MIAQIPLDFLGGIYIRKLKNILQLIVVFLIVCIFTGYSLAAPNEPQNEAWNMNMNTDGSDPSEYFGEWPSHTYYPSPDDWRKIPVYQFVTDRLRDGDPANNEGKYAGYNLYSIGERHGGDFKGIAESLDYIKSLGYKAIWISPVFQNRYNSYHGYGQIDFTLLDDRFGTLEEFREMVNLAHDKGIYIIVDMVANHMSNLFYFEGFPNGGAPFRFHIGEYRLIPYNPDETYRDFWINNQFYSEGQYCDVYNWDGTRKVDQGMGSGSFWFSDFHHNGDLTDYNDPWCNHLGKIYGSLDDLRTTHPRVHDKIIAMTKSLISSTDIDGIRMDTPMQVPLYFFQRWCPAVKAHATNLGKDNFFIFGEFYCERARGATMVGRGREPHQWGKEEFIDTNTFTMDGGINYRMYFEFFEKAVRSQENGFLNQAKVQYDLDWLTYDFYNPARNEYRYRMLNFYSNHDQWRLSYSNDGFEKTNLGSAIIAFWPGIPLFYYGDEQGFCSIGTAFDGTSREDFMTSKAWYDVESMIDTNPAIKDNFDMCHPAYQYVQKLMNIRRQYPALQNTDEIVERWVQPNNWNGIYAYTRIWGEKKNWALIAFNTWKGLLNADGVVTGWDEWDTVVNVFNPSEKHVLGPNGTINLWLGGYETKVYVREDNLKALDPVVNWISPAHDIRVFGDTQSIEVRFSKEMDEASVKTAFRFNGNFVPVEILQYNSPEQKLIYTASISDGIHIIEILESARCLEGKNLFGRFRSRFRKGSDLNPIANPQKDWILNDSLINEGMEILSNEITLYHDSAGAELYRVSNNNGDSWSEWMLYESQTEWTIDADTRNVAVQYWGDGSAAYYTFAKVKEYNFDHVYFRGTPNGWGTTEMELVADNIWEITVTFGMTSNERFKFDIYGDWSLNFGDNDNDGIADETGADIKVAGGKTYIIRFNDSTREYTVVPLHLCEGDFDGDGDVDGSDLAVFALNFGRADCSPQDPCKGDFDGDGDVDGSDLAIFAGDFGRSDCPL